MADDGRFYSESDPEWSVTRLAAHAVAPVDGQGHRRHLLVAAALVAGLAPLAFWMGAHAGHPQRPATETLEPAAATPTPTATPARLRPPAARVTMRALPRPSRTPEPAAATPTYTPVRVVTQAPPPPPETHYPDTPAGPPTPIDPDDR